MKILPKDISEKLQAYLESSINRDQANMGTIRRYDSKTNNLDIIAQKGFNIDFLDKFNIAKPFDSSSVGRAAGLKTTIIISDVFIDKAYPYLKIAKEANFRSAKSTPIIVNDNVLLGVLTTYYREPLSNWEIHDQTDIIESLAELLLMN